MKKNYSGCLTIIKVRAIKPPHAKLIKTGYLGLKHSGRYGTK